MKEKNNKRPSEDSVPIFQDIARFRALIFDSLLKPHGMTMSQGWVLVHLMRQNGLNQAELASRLDIAPVTTSKLIDKLEARGFVERRPDPEDRRSNRVYSTDAGKAMVKIMTQTIRELDGIAYEGIDDAQRRAAMQFLKVVRKNLKAAAARR